MMDENSRGWDSGGGMVLETLRKRGWCLEDTDGHYEITTVEYSHIPSIPNNVVLGTKIHLENKVAVHSGIVCLNPKVLTVLGGVVQSLYEEWEMNQKYSGFSRSSLRKLENRDTGGPPQFVKLQVEDEGSSTKRTFFRACESGLWLFERKKVFFRGIKGEKVLLRVLAEEGEEGSSAGSSGRRFCRFFSGIQRKNVVFRGCPRLLAEEPAEPSSASYMSFSRKNPRNFFRGPCFAVYWFLS
ncbi:hypothetical protein JHK86_010260 [Glycine max]|nr:hypothetical protein JHK86_010260 [Glycine max]